MTENNTPKRDPHGRAISLNSLDDLMIEEVQDLHDALVEVYEDPLTWMDDPDFGACIPTDPDRRALYEQYPFSDQAKADRRAEILTEMIRYDQELEREHGPFDESENAVSRACRDARKELAERNADPTRKAAYEDAMAKFSDRKGLRAYMSEDAIRYVESYDGPVVLGVWKPKS